MNSHFNRRLIITTDTSTSHAYVIGFQWKLELAFVILLVLLPFAAFAQTNTPTANTGDASGLFSERGFSTANSNSQDGYEIINDFNGNLQYFRPLRYLPLTQDGLHADLSLCYNGSASTVISSTIGSPYGKAVNFSVPLWIISLNGIAIQTFNFENEVISWGTDGTNYDSTALEADVALETNGYHNCYGYTYGEGGSSFGSFYTVSILLGDGTIAQYMKADDVNDPKYINGYAIGDGVYHSYSKEDRTKGFMDSYGNFTLFREDGTTVGFRLYRPVYRTTTIGEPTAYEEHRILLPVSFKDQMGHVTTVSYDSTIVIGGISKKIYGRPLVTAACGYTFNWGNLLTGGKSKRVELKRGDTTDFVIKFEDREGEATAVGDSVTIAGNENRGYVTSITDAVNRTTTFEYSSYLRTAHVLQSWIYDAVRDGDTINDFRTAGRYEIYPLRLSKLTYPEGGIVHYSYYNDQASRWPDGYLYSATDELDIAYYNYEMCAHGGNPCKSSSEFANIGRDPFFVNIVTAKTRSIVVGGTTDVISRDSIIYSWNDDNENEKIDSTDIFMTSKYFSDTTYVETLSNKKRTELAYKMYPQKGSFSYRNGDRGWQQKLLEKTGYRWKNDDWREISKEIPTWDIDECGVLCSGCGSWCTGTFLLQQVTSHVDSVFSTRKFGYDLVGDPDEPITSNIEQDTVIDQWGIRTIRYFNTQYLTITDSLSYYDNSLVDRIRVFELISPPDTAIRMLAEIKYIYYGASSDSGYIGQLKSDTTYVFENGSVVDKLSQSYQYLKNYTFDPSFNGCLRKYINSTGDSTVYNYHENIIPPLDYLIQYCTSDSTVIDPVIYKMVDKNGDTIVPASQQINASAPFPRKTTYFLSGSTRTVVDTTVNPCLDSTSTLVSASSSFQGSDSESDVVDDHSQSITCRLVLPSITGYCEAPESNALIKVNGVTRASIQCQSYAQDTTFILAVNKNDNVEASVYHASTHGGSYIAQFRHYDTMITFDTIIRTHTNVPVAALTTFQEVDEEGKLKRAVNSNGFLSETRYDAADRAIRNILPGNFDTTSSVPIDSIYSMKQVYDDSLSNGDGFKTMTYWRTKSGGYTQRFDTRIDPFKRIHRMDIVNASSQVDSSAVAYDFSDRPNKATDDLGLAKNNKYDELNRFTQMEFPDSATSKIKRAYGKALAQSVGLTTVCSMRDSGLYVTYDTNENNDASQTMTDVLGRVRVQVERLSGSDIKTFYDYDPLGHLTRIFRPKGDSTAYTYNSLGWLKQEFSSDYDSILYRYDKRGNLVLKRDGNLRTLDGGSVKYWEYHKYDVLNRMTETGFIEVTGTDTTNRIRTERQFYDQELSSNSQGKLSLTFRHHNSINYGEKYDYDGRGRLIKQINYFEASLDSTSLNGRYQYSLSGTSYTIEYTYNWSDQITSIKYPNGAKVTYDYDDLGRLWKVGDTTDSDRYSTLTYTSRGELQQMKYFSKTDNTVCQTIDYSYNARGWLEKINSGDTVGGDKFGQRIYYYADSMASSPVQKNGNIVGQIFAYRGDTTSRYRYDYDDLNRLTLVQKRGTINFQDKQLFTYDNNGNRATYKTSSSQVYPLNYNYQSGTNRLQSSSGTGLTTSNYSNDPNGNMKTDSSKKATFYYNTENELYMTNIRNASPGLSANEVTYDYNNFGQRVFKSFKIYWQEYCGPGGGEGLMGPDGGGLDTLMFEDLMLIDSGSGGGGMETESEGEGDWCTYNMTSTTRYIVSGGRILAEYSPSSGTPRYWYIYAGDKRIAMRNGTNKLHYYLNDHLGTVRVVVDSVGALQDKYYYTAFGAADVGTSTATGQPQRYTGKTWDDDGGANLYYYGARYYDPTLGRFTQTDPMSAKYGYLSPYVYTANNPLKYTDPDGRDIALAVQHSGAHGAGHTFLLIGSDKKGWTAVSFEKKSGSLASTAAAFFGVPVTGKLTMTEFGKNVSLDDIINKKLKTQDDFHADEVVVAHTTEAQDEIAIQTGEDIASNPPWYHLYYLNCNIMASYIAIRSGVYNFYPSPWPNQAFALSSLLNLGEQDGIAQDIAEFQAKMSARAGHGRPGRMEPWGTVTITDVKGIWPPKPKKK